MISPKKRDRYLTLSKDAMRKEFAEFCLLGKWEEIKFFTKRSELLGGLTEKELVYTLSVALESACAGGHVDIVQYLLTSPLLKYHADVNYNNTEALIKATRLNRLEVVKYLLDSPELEIHADVHAQLESVFLIALKHKDTVILKYLILEHKIEKTERIESFIKKEINEVKLFELREFQEKLENDLSIQNPNTKKLKI